MSTSARIYGNKGVVLTLKKGAGTPTAFGDDCKGITISGEDKDDSDLTFAEAASGAVQNPVLKIKLIQSTAAASLHQFLFDNQGEVVEAVYAPHGNASPSTTQPHFKVTNLKIEGIPEIGGDATRERTGFETEVEIGSQDGTVTKITT